MTHRTGRATREDRAHVPEPGRSRRRAAVAAAALTALVLGLTGRLGAGDPGLPTSGAAWSRSGQADGHGRGADAVHTGAPAVPVRPGTPPV
ncbi:hypothetical protein ACH4NF_01415 [Streptomyces sp. NPDC017248]|uniref:hypothetical protein n=1 Tax=unclassified Streptomyces TaxID=2593676 RepID=UPI003789164B